MRSCWEFVAAGGGGVAAAWRGWRLGIVPVAKASSAASPRPTSRISSDRLLDLPSRRTSRRRMGFAGDVEPSLGQRNRPRQRIRRMGSRTAVVAAHHAVQQAFGYNGREAAAESLNHLNTLEKTPTHDPRPRAQHADRQHRLPRADESAGAAAGHPVPRPSRGRHRGDADRDLPDRQHRRADRRADAGASLRGRRSCASPRRIACSGGTSRATIGRRRSSTTACASARTRSTSSPDCAPSIRPSRSTR